jgi:hypothetical protein
MHATQRFVIIGALLFASAMAAAQSQQSIRDQIFGETDAVKQQADDLQAALLAPEAYAEGLELYVSATETMERGRNLDRARSDLAEAKGHFERSIEAAKLANVTFAGVLQARTAARNAQAERFAERDWGRAEEALMAAAQTLEEGNLTRAQRAATDAETRYRETESRAITAQARGK